MARFDALDLGMELRCPQCEGAFKIDQNLLLTEQLVGGFARVRRECEYCNAQLRITMDSTLDVTAEIVE